MTQLRTLLTLTFLTGLAVTGPHAQQVPRTKFDVRDYKVDVELVPAENRLTATADVVLVPGSDTRTVTFELNGSLAVESVVRVTEQAAPAPTPVPPARGRAPRPTPSPTPTPGPQVTFIQDRVGVSAIGPSVRVDFGETVAADSSVTLRFKYSGVLVNAEGGPLLTKRLAYVGSENGYLMYAARWFPFNDYAADRATSDITIRLPKEFVVAGYSDSADVNEPGRHRFTQTEPGLVGNFAYGRYTVSSVKFGSYDIKFFTKAADQRVLDAYGETLGRALEFYSGRFGPVSGGRQMTVAQIDDDSLDFFSGRDMMFMAGRFFGEVRESALERLQREAAYQWWGLTVGLASFDDAWVSQGLAEFSAVEFRESQATGAKLELLRRELLEKALTFEQTASIVRAPASLDDQSNAYQYIMFGKGPFVFRLLRDTLGEQKFARLLNLVLERYKGKNLSIDDFEKLASEVHGESLRYFFARWVEGTGVPEFLADYEILRTRTGKFVTRGTVRQNYDNLRLPLELQLRSEGNLDAKPVTVLVEDASADFNIESDGKPLEVVIDPGFKILRTSDDLRVSAIARRGIELFKEGNLVEAQQQFEAALKLDKSNGWIYYHLGLIYLQQRNYDLAIDNFKVITQGLKGNVKPGWLYVWSFIKMGNAYDAKGDRARAIDAYKKAEGIGDNYDGALDAAKRYLGTPFDPKERSTVTGK